jgi:hypothetical protein
VVSIGASNMLDGAGFESAQGQGIFLFCQMSRLAVGPKQPPIQLLLCSFLRVKWLGHGVNHLYLVSRSRMSGAIPLLHSWCGQGQLPFVLNLCVDWVRLVQYRDW